MTAALPPAPAVARRPDSGARARAGTRSWLPPMVFHMRGSTGETVPQPLNQHSLVTLQAMKAHQSGSLEPLQPTPLDHARDE